MGDVRALAREIERKDQARTARLAKVDPDTLDEISKEERDSRSYERYDERKADVNEERADDLSSLLAALSERHEGPESGEPSSLDCAEWAHRALAEAAFQTRQTGQFPEHGVLDWDQQCLYEVAGDLIANVFHLARLNGVDADALVERARGYFDEETAEQQAAAV